MYNCINACEDMSTPDNKYDVLIANLHNEIIELCKTSTAKFLLYDEKVSELCTYIKANLSNAIQCLISDMQLSGELDKIINEVVLNTITTLEIDVNDLKNQTIKNVTPQMFGAMGDGLIDDTESIQKAVDFCESVHSFFGSTNCSVQPALHFPCGKYLINETIFIKNKWLNIDFGNSIFIKNFDNGFMFDITCYKNKVAGGVFVGDNIFYIHNPNDDQGHAIYEKQEFKKCDICFDVDMQSSKVTIRDNTFDDCMHPLIQHKSDGLTFENNWCTCGVPEDYGSNIKLLGGSTYFNNNLLTPLTTGLNGKETAWIENKQRSLICTNNRFGGEEGCRTAVNHKQKYTNDNSIYLKFTNNLVQAQRDEKSAIRLFDLPNTFIVKDNYHGPLMYYTVSISELYPISFNNSLTEIKNMYLSNKNNENAFAYPKFRMFHYEINNNFKNTRGDINDKYREIQRENEWWFLIDNYNKVDRLNDKTLSFGYDYKSQELPENIGTNAKPIYLFPVCVAGGVKMSVRFNPNTLGAGYNILKEYNIFKTVYYDNATGTIKKRFVAQDINADVYPDDVNAMVTVGYHNGNTPTFTEEYTTDDLFVALKISNTSVGNVRVTFTKL